MKRSEKGFTILEILIITGIAILMIVAAANVTFRVIQDTQRTNAHITAVHHADSAAYWLTHDTQMANSMTTEDLTSPEFLVLTWTDWVYDGDSIYHTVTYSIEDVTEGIGKLKRTHQDSSGIDEQTLVAENIYYYNPLDPDNTTQITSQNLVLDFKIVTSFGEALAVREHKIYCRPNF